MSLSVNAVSSASTQTALDSSDSKNGRIITAAAGTHSKETRDINTIEKLGQLERSWALRDHSKALLTPRFSCVDKALAVAESIPNHYERWWAIRDIYEALAEARHPKAEAVAKLIWPQ